MFLGILEKSLAVVEQYLIKENTQESRKYLDKMLYLKRTLYYEQAKSDDSINHALIDNLNNELCILLDAIASIGIKDSWFFE